MSLPLTSEKKLVLIDKGSWGSLESYGVRDAVT